MARTPREFPNDPVERTSRALPFRVLGAFHQLMHSYRQLMSRKLAEYGAHPGQTFCLREIAHNDGITQRDLAENLHVARPTVTVMLQKMQKAGLVERRSDEHDRRYTRIYLTDSGWALHDEMHRLLDEVVAEVIGPLSEKDQAELVRLLGALNDNMLASIGDSVRELADHGAVHAPNDVR
ncbi:MAG: MarR family winged helix-turn-helix transcriptional regulator [Coriobacteriia bacterium]|nr:MarR family winged helix-turn-helix transcriptional regulator [Coriobacteriia bacterium]